VLDVSNPYEPEHVTTLAMPESAVPLSIVIEGNYAFVSSSGQWITDATFIFDISNPRHPVQVARIPNGVFFGVHDGSAYLYNADSGLDVWDVSNPSEPIFHVTIELPLTYWEDLNVYVNDIRDITFDDDYAYIALNELGLHILDISNPNIAEAVGVIQYGNLPHE
ncbi:MAG: hypothetical protein KDE28_04025, partial [Anaerolineales bacterium]|nr:hypothetical protein [Anaerolineales bacterium]